MKNILIAGCFFALVYSAKAQSVTEVYRWKSVQIAGGGFVDGVVYHPTAKGVLYCRTDMGGAYRWNDHHQIWEPLLDWVSYQDVNLMGVESIALDPSDPKYLYLACGTYTTSAGPNAILRSDDKGKHLNVRMYHSTWVGMKMAGVMVNAWRSTRPTEIFYLWVPGSTVYG
jgi:hypothetical protein